MNVRYPIPTHPSLRPISGTPHTVPFSVHGPASTFYPPVLTQTRPPITNMLPIRTNLLQQRPIVTLPYPQAPTTLLPNQVTQMGILPPAIRTPVPVSNLNVTNIVTSSQIPSIQPSVLNVGVIQTQVVETIPN